MNNRWLRALLFNLLEVMNFSHKVLTAVWCKYRFSLSLFSRLRSRLAAIDQPARRFEAQTLRKLVSETRAKFEPLSIFEQP